MGDNGQLYQGFDKTYVEAMRNFCQQADVIIPNMTEASPLTGSPYLKDNYDKATIEKLLRDLGKLGPKKSFDRVSLEEGKIGLAYFDKENEQTTHLMRPSYSTHFMGVVTS